MVEAGVALLCEYANLGCDGGGVGRRRDFVGHDFHFAALFRELEHKVDEVETAFGAAWVYPVDGGDA